MSLAKKNIKILGCLTLKDKKGNKHPLRGVQIYLYRKRHPKNPTAITFTDDDGCFLMALKN